MANAIDKFELITNKIISLIEAGVSPWRKPWKGMACQNLVSGHKYQGINPILCTVDMLTAGYSLPYFVGFNQAKELGWSVIKGSKSTWIRWGGPVVKEIEDPVTGEVVKEFYNCFKFHNVFNIACIDDSKGQKKISDFLPQPIDGKENSPIAAAEELLSKHTPNTQFGGDVAE